MTEPREIEQTGSKIIDDLLSIARESGVIVKITEEVKEDGHTRWAAEFRVPAWGRPGSLLRQEQDHAHLAVVWTRTPGSGRRPRFLIAFRWGMTSHKELKTNKDMRSELHSMRREAEKATARLALRKGGKVWRLETRGHRHETLTARTVTLAEAEHLVVVASELNAITAEEIRFLQWDTEAKELIRSALVPDPHADPQHMVKKAEARAEGLIPNSGNYLVTREDAGGYVSRTIVQRAAAVALVAAGITSGGDVTSDGETVTIAYEDGTRTVRRTFDDGDTVTVHPGTPNEFTGMILRPARSGNFRVREPQHGTACDYPAVDMVAAKGMPVGAHMITNTGESVEGGTAYAFKCSHCRFRLPLAEFYRARCNQKAERDHARERAERLLSDRTFEGATAYEISGPGRFGGTYVHVVPRGEARESLALWLDARGTHTWGRGELRIQCFHSDHTVRPVVTVGAVIRTGRKAVTLSRDPWRGGQICGHQTQYGMGAYSERYCGERKAPGLPECREHYGDTLSNYGPRVLREAVASGVALGDPSAPVVLLWEPWEGAEPVEPTEEERAAYAAAQG